MLDTSLLNLVYYIVWLELFLCLPATDKVALLIGNLSYRNHPQLKAPMVDVYDLTNLLRQLNFKVVSLLDLTESEMRNAVDEFLLLLHKGVYGVLGLLLSSWWFQMGTRVQKHSQPKTWYELKLYTSSGKMNRWKLIQRKWILPPNLTRNKEST